MSTIRMTVPFRSGGVRSGRVVGSAASSGRSGTGVSPVLQTSWNTASGIAWLFGTGPSDRTTERPRESWPVTTRRGARLISNRRHRGHRHLGAELRRIDRQRVVYLPAADRLGALHDHLAAVVAA